MQSTEIARLCLLGALAAGCSTSPQAPAGMPAGVRHGAGSSFAEVRTHYGVPILQRSFFWDGNGEVDDSGIGFHAGSCLTDHIAIGAGSNLTSWWTPGRDVYSIEAEGLLRAHPFDSVPVFFDATGGYQLANDQIPPGGTVWNFTFGFGGGVEVPLDRGTALLAGVHYHHISNALGRDNDRNPSQNEARLWLGVEWSF